MSDSPVRRFGPDFHWESIDVLHYKRDADAPFRDVTRQTLFRRDDLAGELRYFEVAPGGHTTLERHEHTHAVMVLRGRGRCLVGDDVHPIAPYDLVTIAPFTWHQFRAARGEPLGFLCMVDATRDRPQLPDEQVLRALRTDDRIRAFLDGIEPERD